MTRYSRQVIPGRGVNEGDTLADLDRQVFGAKKKHAVPANEDEPDFLPPVEDEEASQLVDRANSDRRRADRRALAKDRRNPDYVPLPKTDRGYRAPEDSKRGPMLLVGALVIVAVFGVVVWNAYREGVKVDGVASGEPPTVGSSGAFKTPGRDMAQATKPAPAEDAEVLEQLEGSPKVVASAPETHPEPAAKPAPAAKPPVQTATAAPAPAPSKVTAVPPTPLKQPAPTPPAAAKPVTTTAAAIPLTPAATPAPAPTKTVTPAASPAPAPSGSYTPAFAAAGSFTAQIAAASSEAGALAEWNKQAKSSPELFATAERFVIRADVDGKTVYRLRAGSFASKADAEAFCSAFKAKGGKCFPAAK